ncbi:hypothetical protein RJ640_027701 [Escallonia rubra]|uniref:Reverse transcriptase Ty1/copia-type domain-containing protein n=1 Tax=Escallonia rubra TaxID=112253 RepID=A0AA88UUD9_9ASTE|nr:hypothetical protein RJ640_027701 [Escallonia rubra]
MGLPKQAPSGRYNCKIQNCLVAKGFHQHPGLNYVDNFRPITKPATVRVILSLTNVLSKLASMTTRHQWCFLYDALHDDVYMSQPSGFFHSTIPNHVCKLRKALYGLKQVPRAWYQELKGYLLPVDFIKSVADASLFFYSKDVVPAFFFGYMLTKFILTRNDTDFLHSFVKNLNLLFSLKDLGPLHHFLGVPMAYFYLNTGTSVIYYTLSP